MEVEGEGTQRVEQLAIVERYETVIAYLYPIVQNIGRRHGTAKAMFIEALLGQVKLFVEAGKSDFLGYRIWPRHKLLRKQSVVRARRAIASAQRRGDAQRLALFVAAWRGHARHADVCNLFNHMEGRYGVALHHQ